MSDRFHPIAEDRIAAAKSTLVKALSSGNTMLRGERHLSKDTKIGYFAQHQLDLLRPESSPVDHLQDYAPGDREQDHRNYLGRFGFSGERIFEPVAPFSGGEKARLVLALMIRQGPNLLLLDEPTNHLDIPSQEILQEVLSEFAGTILLVSHDRYLIDALGTQIWDIIPERKALRVFKGTYSEYHAELEAEQEVAESQLPVKTSSRQRSGSNQRKKGESRRKYRLQEIESQIAELEEQLAGITLQLEKPPVDSQTVEELGEDYVQIQNEINALLAEWEQLHE